MTWPKLPGLKVRFLTVLTVLTVLSIFCPFTVPKVLTQCSQFIESHGIVDGIYRVSGIASNIKKLKALFDTQTVPEALEKGKVLFNLCLYGKSKE